MIEKKMYQCEICGTEYSDKSKCKECEKSHRVPDTIVDARYVAKSFNNKGYPVSVTIRMDDGKDIIYKR